MKSAVAVPLSPERSPIEVRRLGRREYEEVLILQEEARAQVLAGGPEQLLIVEHPPVITLGRGAKEAHLRFPRESLVQRGVDAGSPASGWATTSWPRSASAFGTG